jgi:glycosyltransferase involved in cell wall biosynthesis
LSDTTSNGAESKKLAIVINSSWAAFNFRLNLARNLKTHGYKVIFIAPYEEKYSDLIALEFDFFNVELDPQGLNPIYDLKTLISLFLLLKKESVDLSLNFSVKPNIYSSIASRLINISCMSNVSGLGTVFVKKSFATKIVKYLYKISIGYNKKVFFQNESDRKLFVQSNLVQSKITEVLPGSGVDLNKFIPLTKSKSSRKITFLFIGRLLKDKGLIEYIEAIKIVKQKHNNVEFQILGSIENTNVTVVPEVEVREWIEAGLVSYLGKTDSVERVISDCDCVVLPSYREGLPRSLLEAGAMEKPVIATDVPGCRDAVDDGITGFLCKVKNSQDLADKISLMVNLTADQRSSMGKAGRTKVLKEFDENVIFNKYLTSIKLIFKNTNK